MPPIYQYLFLKRTWWLVQKDWKKNSEMSLVQLVERCFKNSGRHLRWTKATICEHQKSPKFASFLLIPVNVNFLHFSKATLAVTVRQVAGSVVPVSMA